MAPESSDPTTDPRILRIAAEDNVGVALAALAVGETVVVDGRQVALAAPVPSGHKLALCAIAAGQKVIKYGAPIGSATRDIAPGDHVHSHNLASDY